MNYQRLHDSIIQDSRQSSPIGFKHKNKTMGYKEKHHIIPRCIGGTNDPENLIYLTARRHFIIHRLLTKLHPNHTGIIYAFQLMFTKTSSKRNSRRSEDPGWIRSISKNYEEFKILRSMVVVSEETRAKLRVTSTSNTNTRGRKHTNEARVLISLAGLGNKHRLGTTHNDETRQKMSQASLGKIKSETHRANISKAKKGKSFSEEHKAKLRESRKRQVITPEHKAKLSAATKLIWAKRKAARFNC